jgi:ankyrin repeat protein
MIDGHAFCLGVEPMMRSYDAPPDLQSLIHSVAYLIRGAIFRPRGPNWVPNEVCPLSDLIDMYHTHEATLHSDEVYALLGMSSDGLLQPGLSPDYDVPWKVLFETLIKHALCKEITVDVLPDGESAKIEGRGYILGWISSIQAGTTPSGRQGVTITWREFQDTTIRRTDWICHWEIQPSAKQIMGGDIICLFQGASRPTIMRFCDGCWAIIVIAITPPQLIRPRSGKSQWLECLEEINRLFPRNFRCVWDWDKLPGKMPSQEENKTPRECLEQIKETLNLTLVLEDLERYREGEEQFQEAMIYYEMASKKRCTNEFSASLPSFMSRVDLDLMNEKHYRPPLLWAAERGYVSVVLLFIARFDVDIGFKDYNGRTAIELAAANGHLTVVERLLEYNADVISTAARKSRIALRAAAVGRNLTLYKELLPAKEYVNAAVAAAADNKRAALLTAADGGYLPVVQRLLQEDIDVNAPAVRNGRTALQAAAGGGHLLVVEHLLQENADVNAPAAVHNGKPALYTAAGGGHLPVAMRRLKRNRGANAAAAFNGRTALQAAAGGGHLAVVERLLQENADVNAAQWNGRTALQAAVEGGHLAVVELLRRHEDLQSSVEH